MQAILHIIHSKKRYRLAAFFVLILVAVSLLAGASLAVQASNTAPDIAPAGNNSVPALNTAPQQEVGCAEGYKVDDLHVGLPDWVIHARLASDPDATVYTKTTDGTGFFRFDDLPVGRYLFWEEIPEGWTWVTSPQFEADVNAPTPDQECTEIRFKNKQATATPTPEPPPATRIQGIVYNLTCDGLIPLPDITLRTYRSEDPNDLGVLAQTRTTITAGPEIGQFFFYLPPPAPSYYHTVVEPPVGLEPLSAFAPEGDVVAPDHIRINFPELRWYTDNIFILQDPDQICETPIPPTPTPTLTPTPTSTPSLLGCVEGRKVDDLHVGLPDWEIRARPAGFDSPVYTAFTDGTGYFRFDDLEPGTYTFWEIIQEGWIPVTSPEFDAYVAPGDECTRIRFKNRQATPTPTLTPTATTSPPRLYLPMILTPGGVCEEGTLNVIIYGKLYSHPLTPDGNVKSIPPLPWKFPTTFYISNYVGAVTWTQYQPYYHKQIGGYTFTFPGGHAGEEFSLFVNTECGALAVETEIDDPTPTPTPTPNAAPTATPAPPTATPVAQGWTTILAEDFDNGLDAWTTEGDPTWDATECRSQSSPASVWPAASGENAAEACTDTYRNNMQSWLIYGPFDLSDASAAEVTFDYWLKTERDYDFLQWLASTDGEHFYGYQISGDSDGWTSRTFDLSAIDGLGDLRGEDEVWFAFIFDSDTSNNDVGAFVDNVEIRKYVGGEMAPSGRNQNAIDANDVQAVTQTR